MLNNQPKLDFMRWRILYFAISLVVIVPGLISLFLYGLKPSIDFTGGTLLELQFNKNAGITEQVIRNNLPEGVTVGSIQATQEGAFLLRAAMIDAKTNELIQQKLASVSGSVSELRYENVGPTLGKELLRKMITAIVLAASLILLYVAYRFKNLKYGVCAILAMFHDTLVLLGSFSLLGHFLNVEVDTLYVTALLTILSFSVHDTIVVYDRIREMIKLHPRASYKTIINAAVAQTLARSINNSMTIIFMLLALWLMGGESTKWFVFALLIGTVTGTYSSTFTAAPLLVLWDDLIKLRKTSK